MTRTNKFGRTDYIPAPIALEIRKRCGFACVVCASPFYDYEHWNPPFEDLDEEPSADGITLACPNHHRTKGGLLSREDYEKAIADPRALRDGFWQTKWSKGFEPAIVIGNVRCLGPTRILSINGETMIGFDPPEENGAPPLLTCRFFGRDGQQVFRIDNNLCIGNPKSWDLTSKKIDTGGWRWQVRNGTRKIDLELELHPPDEIRIPRMVWRKGFLQVVANERGLQVSVADTPPQSVLLLRGGTASPLRQAHGFLDVTISAKATANGVALHHQLSVGHMKFEGAKELSMAKDAVL